MMSSLSALKDGTSLQPVVSHDGGPHSFAMPHRYLVSCAAGSNADALPVTLDGGEVSIRSQTGNGLPG